MKKLIIALSSFALIAIGTSSCVKSFQCECTYIYSDIFDPSATKPDIKETTNIKARAHEFASIDCTNLEFKYNSKDYSGTCLIQ